MASSTLATRLTPPLLDEVRRFAKRRRLGPSEALRTIVSEWVTTARYPAVEFRDGPVGRRPGLRGGPDLWEVAMVARSTGDDPAALRRHFGAHLTTAALQDALACIAEHRDEIEAWVDENERFGDRAEHGPAAQAYASAVRALSFEQKLRVAEELRASAWAVAAAGVRRAHPDWRDEDVERQVSEVFFRGSA